MNNTLTQNITEEALNPNLLVYCHENIKPAVVEYYYKFYLEQLIEENSSSQKSTLLEKALAHQKPRFKKQLIRKVLGMYDADVRGYHDKKIKQETNKIF